MDNDCYHTKITRDEKVIGCYSSHSSGAQSNYAAAAASASMPDADISSLQEMIGSVGDPRSDRGKQQELAFVLAVCVVAALAGAKGVGAENSVTARGLGIFITRPPSRAAQRMVARD